MIKVKSVSKTIGKEQILSDVSFHCPSGKITGFIGPNGAGKTTTFKLLLNLMKPDDDTADIVFGDKRIKDFKLPMQQVGASMELEAMGKHRKGIDHLRAFAPLTQASDTRIKQLLEEVDLTKAMHKRVGSYSLGMKQRLSLATALLGDPNYLILDEPANGLDPDGIHWIREYLKHLAGQGKTIIVSSHLLTEAQKFVDHVVAIKSGKIVFEGDLDNLRVFGETQSGKPIADLEDAYRAIMSKEGK